MFGDSFRTGMTMDSSGVIERGITALYNVQVTDSHGDPDTATERGWWGRMVGSGLPFADRGRLPVFVFVATATAGIAAALHYSAAGLTLAHYDAKAHLVVARRIFDS